GRAFWFYPHTLIWPRSLAFIYPRWSIESDVWWQYVFPVTAVMVIVALYLGRSRIGRGPVVATLCYAGSLAPVSGFFDLYFLLYSFVADRFAYLPSIPLIVLTTTAGAELARRGGRAGRRLAVVTGCALLLTLGVFSFRRCGIYRTPRGLWADTVAQ